MLDMKTEQAIGLILCALFLFGKHKKISKKQENSNFYCNFIRKQKN